MDNEIPHEILLKEAQTQIYKLESNFGTELNEVQRRLKDIQSDGGSQDRKISTTSRNPVKLQAKNQVTVVKLYVELVIFRFQHSPLPNYFLAVSCYLLGCTFTYRDEDFNWSASG
jgi:hypothetical protein